MANRQNKFLIKRSNVAGKIPSPGDLLLGEMALNTADVILYTSGTTADTILPIGWDRIARTGDTIGGNLIVTGSTQSGTISATTISATTFYGDGSNLTGIDDFYVTNGTYSGGTLTLDRGNGSVTITGFTESPISPYRVFRLTGGTSYTFTDYTTVNTLSINKTTGSNTTVVLNQSPNNNDTYTVKDTKGDSILNPITVSGGTYTIDGNSVIEIKKNNNPSFTFLFDGVEYIII